jgi:hypothetical protein
VHFRRRELKFPAQEIFFPAQDFRISCAGNFFSCAGNWNFLLLSININALRAKPDGGKHGFFSFFRFKKGSFVVHPVNAANIKNLNIRFSPGKELKL